MENKNDRLQNIIQNFNSLDKKEQKKVSSHIDSVWYKAHKEYIEMCAQDEELCQLYDKLKEIEQIMSFDLGDYYYVCVDEINAWDPECAQYAYEFDPEQWKEAKYVSEHLEEILAPLQAKRDDLQKQLDEAKAELEKIENGNILFKRIRTASMKSRIHTLEKELFGVNHDIRHNEYTAKSYKEHFEQQQLKEHYQQNYETLVAPYKKKYEERTKMYAEKVIDKYIETDPVILCVEHTSYISGGNQRTFGSEALNKACNGKRYEVMFDIKQTKGIEK